MDAEGIQHDRAVGQLGDAGYGRAQGMWTADQELDSTPTKAVSIENDSPKSRSLICACSSHNQVTDWHECCS